VHCSRARYYYELESSPRVPPLTDAEAYWGKSTPWVPARATVGSMARTTHEPPRTTRAGGGGRNVRCRAGKYCCPVAHNFWRATGSIVISFFACFFAAQTKKQKKTTIFFFHHCGRVLLLVVLLLFSPPAQAPVP
jgi:hypothetical protein